MTGARRLRGLSNGFHLLATTSSTGDVFRSGSHLIGESILGRPSGKIYDCSKLLEEVLCIFPLRL